MLLNACLVCRLRIILLVNKETLINGNKKKEKNGKARKE